MNRIEAKAKLELKRKEILECLHRGWGYCTGNYHCENECPNSNVCMKIIKILNKELK